ncbi:MAG: hypothetical protein ACYCX5_04525 [Coriobacteriia bacterium]
MRDGLLPSVDQIATALAPIVKMGLPVDSDFSDETLLGLPGVLRRSHEPEDRLSRIRALDELIREQLDRYPDDARKEAATVLLGKAGGSRRRTIGERRETAARLLGVQTEHVRTGIQPKIVKMLAWLLHCDAQDAMRSITQTSSLAQVEHCVSTSSDPVPTSARAATLSPEAHREAQQLYWYAQETSVLVQSFEIAARATDALCRSGARNHAAASAASQSSDIERAMWAFAHCCAHLRSLERENTGRVFIREHFSVSPWQMGLGARFTPDEIVELLSALGEAAVDEPNPFIEALLARDQGLLLEQRWLRLMKATAVKHARRPVPLLTSGRGVGRDGEGRFRLIEALVELVATLRPVFPEQTQTDRETGSTCLVTVFGLMREELEGRGPEAGSDVSRAIEVDHAIEAAAMRMRVVWTGRRAPGAAGKQVKLVGLEMPAPPHS